MKFSGSVPIDAPRAQVWAFVIDPFKIGKCGPGVESIEQIDGDHFTAKARVIVGPINFAFDVDGEFTERTAPTTAGGRGHGSAPGTEVDGFAQMTLRDGSTPGTTVMDWTADVQFSGKLASLGTRLIEGTANKLIGETFTCVKSQLEGPPAEYE